MGKHRMAAWTSSSRTLDARLTSANTHALEGYPDSNLAQDTRVNLNNLQGQKLEAALGIVAKLQAQGVSHTRTQGE